MRPTQGEKATKRPAVLLEDIQKAVTDALIDVMMPLSSLALDTGFSIEDIYRLLRLAAVNQFVKAAEADSVKYSISGIAAVTGIPRSEVSKLLKRAAPLVSRGRVNEQTTNAVLAAWREDSRFTSAEGKPASLKMYGRGRSFERLAKLHGRGIPARALLDELKRTNSISVGSDQIVHQNAGIAVERGVTTASIRSFGEQVSDLMTTIVHNMKNPKNPRLVSRVSSRLIPSDRVPLVRREIAKMTEHYLSEAQELLVRYSKDDRETHMQSAGFSINMFCTETAILTRAGSGKKRKNYRRVL